MNRILALQGLTGTALELGLAARSGQSIGCSSETTQCSSQSNSCGGKETFAW